MYFNERPFRRKPYDRYLYAMADEPEALAELNRNLKRSRQDWHVIGQGTKVVNGIYVPPEEWKPAVKVDYSLDGKAENPEVYEDYLDAVRTRMTSGSGNVNPIFLPRAAYDTVREKMRLSRTALSQNAGSGIDDLSEFMSMKEGQPIHLTLACAALIDIMTPGVRTSVETGMRVDQDETDQSETHTWVRFEERRSGIVRIRIVDPVKGFCGFLDDSTKKGRWDYRRPEDKYAPVLSRPLPETYAGVAVISLDKYRESKNLRNT